MLLVVALLVACLGSSKSFLTDQQHECPEECECHHFRINWVTDCSESNLTSIPEEGLALETYILDLTSNHLEEIRPLAEGIKLRVLRLAYNNIQEIRKEVFSTLTYLIELDLSYNRIIHIQTDAFLANHGLIKLDLEGNPLYTKDGPLLESRSLMYLSLRNCSMDEISATNKYLLDGVEGLNRLDLSRNPIVVLHNGFLNSLERLQYLLLNDCKLTSIGSEAMMDLENLKELELRDNPGLVSIGEWLPPLSMLEKLDLRRSGLRGLDKSPFTNNTWLTTVLFGCSPLGPNLTVTEGFDLLESLDLSNCGIESLQPGGTALFKATRLVQLDLSANPIPVEQLALLLKPLVRLTRLSLRNCSLEGLPGDETFSGLSELRELDLSHNPLGGAFTGKLSPLTTLIRLDMSYSGIVRLARSTFSAMTSLETLVLSGNPLVGLESGLFENLTHLKVLDLSDCGLSRLRSTVFHDDFTYLDLVELRLGRNPLRVDEEGSFLPQQMPGLLVLDLSRCNMSRIPPHALASFGNLTSLLLAGNALEDEEGQLEFLQYLPLLEELDLRSNKLRTLDPFELRFNHELRTLRLADNPWLCGCHVADIWDWALTVRGDLSVLPGSTLSNDESEPKKKKALLCRMEEGGGRMSWWRYVRSSDCDSSRRAQALSGEEGDHDGRDIWWWIVLLAMLTVTTLTLGRATLRKTCFPPSPYV